MVKQEYIYKEKEQCPYCDAKMTNGRLIHHVSRKHDDKFHEFMEKEKHRFDELIAALKEAQ